MTVKVNGVALTDADVSAEMARHQDADNALDMALNTLVVRRLLLDEASRLGVGGPDDESVISALLAQEVALPEVDESACRRHYDQHPAHFVVGELIEADHILFQVTSGVDLEALRRRAQDVLAQALADPGRFEELACAFSNCPSSVTGGSLGQLQRGDTVPEFERAVFSMPAGQILPRLLETRFGLHIVRVARHVDGQRLPYAQVRDTICDALVAANRDTAWRQYLQGLAGRARIEGLSFYQGADGPLVQ